MRPEDRAIGAGRRSVRRSGAVRPGERPAFRTATVAIIAASLAVALTGCSRRPFRAVNMAPEVSTSLEAVQQLEADSRNARRMEQTAWSNLLAAYGDARSTHEALAMPEIQAWHEAVSAADDATTAEWEAKREWLIAASLALGQHAPSEPAPEQ